MIPAPFRDGAMRRVLLAFLLLFSTSLWADTRDAETHFFQPKFGDFKTELEAAQQQGKKGIFVFFEMENCPFCARMKSTILNQIDVQEAYRALFLVYSIDVNGATAMTDFQGRETTEKAFALANRARATPTLMFFDLSGKAVALYAGPTRDKAEFLLFGRYLADGAYATRSFAQYKQGK
jgi:thioredoxin-related protein